MLFLKYINKLFILASSVIFIYISFLLLSNASKGFDITDQSYYILNAQYPNEVFSVLTHEGYYTGLLYYVSGYDLSYFRIYGILLLILMSVWFSIEIYKYIIKKFEYSINTWDKFLFIVSIPMASLFSYKSWLLTPSYNWLALVSVILFFISLFRIVRNKELNYSKYISIDYFLLSFSFTLAFMAKPTTTIVLIIISILFIIYEFKNINLKKALPSVIITTSIIVSMHILILDGGFISYYYRVIESLERAALMGGGHSLDNIYVSVLDQIKDFFFERFYFHKINNYYFYGVSFMLIIIFIMRNRINSLNIYKVLMPAVFVVYSYFIFIETMYNQPKWMWFGIIELLLLNLLLVFISIFFIDEKIDFLKKILKITLVMIILVLGSFAYSFGTGSHIVYAMSSSIVFLMAASLVLNLIFDQKLNIRIFNSLTGLIIAIFLYFTIVYTYEHPYRLITGIEGQNQSVELLGGLKVDKKTKKYINELHSMSNKYRVKGETISLIDMTGGSPGANVILNARFFSASWILGAYKGSDKLASRILKHHENTKRLKTAWILTAPNGRRKIDLNILNKIGLNFPKEYKKIGSIQTAHRNEMQELWKPK